MMVEIESCVSVASGEVAHKLDQAKAGLKPFITLRSVLSKGDIE